MKYETRSKVYKLVCSDGHYYYGSTITSLQHRLSHHKSSSETMTSKLYGHIRAIGWNNVEIELVEAPVCKNRTELRMAENVHILRSKDDPLCLNTLNSYTSEEDKRQMEKERQTRNKDHRKEVVKQYYDAHKDEINKRSKQYYEEHKADLQTKQKEYLEQNKETINAQRKQYYEANKERLCQEKREKRNQDKETAIQKGRDYREKNRERINELKRIAYHKSKPASTDTPNLKE